MIHNNTQTSIAAALAIKPHAQKQREQVMTALDNAGANGCTREELQQATGLDGDSLRPRVWQLQRDGRIATLREVRKTAAGRGAQVLVSSHWFVLGLYREIGARMKTKRPRGRPVTSETSHAIKARIRYARRIAAKKEGSA